MLAEIASRLPDSSQVAQRGADIWEKLASFEMPSQAEYVGSLTTMHLATAIILFACGMVYLLHGWKTFKVLVIVNAALLGGFLGGNLGRLLQGQNMPVFCGAAGALLLAVLAWPLMKVAIGVMGGLAGGFLGYGMWAYVSEAIGRPAIAEHAWAGALIGLVTLGLLGFVIFRLVVMVFTSFQGAMMAVSGLVAMLMRLGPLRVRLHDNLASNIHLMVLLIGTPTIIGFAFQYAAMAKKAQKKKKAIEGG